MPPIGPFYPEEPDDNYDNLPPVEAEDIGCSCNDAGFDSEWLWDDDQSCYVCYGCGEVQ